MESCKDGYKRMDFEDDMLDIGGYNPYGIPMGDMCDGMFNDVYFINDMFIPPPSISTDNECESDERWGVRVLSWTKVQRHLAILRTNRQIYNEASALLHSDLTIDVNTDSVKQTKNIWRHGPSDGLGFTNTSGQRVYRSNLLNGLVEPHVFAQFQKVSYHADFSANFQRNAPTLHINDDLSVKAEDAAKFVSYLTTVKGTTRWFEDPVSSRFDNGRRQTVRDVTGITVSSFTVAEPSTADIVQNFVDIISRSPLIRQLEFIVNFEAGLSDSPVDSSLDSDSDLDSEQKAKGAEKRIEKAEMARERATELFMESGVLNCLCKLPNVKCFSLEVATLGRGGKIMKLRRKHLNIVRDLKETIEKNWMAKHGSD